jgi:hypothetical protein
LLGHWAGEWPRSQQKYALDQLASGTSGRLQGGRVMSNAKLNATRSALFATEAKSIMIARGSVATDD